MNYRRMALDKALAFDPPVSEKQRRAMWAAVNGKSTLGIPKKVGEEFVGRDAEFEESKHPRAPNGEFGSGGGSSGGGDKPKLLSEKLGYHSDGSDGRVPTYRSQDGAPVLDKPRAGSFAEKRGIKVGSKVAFSGTSMYGEAISGQGKVVGFVTNKRGYSGSGKGAVSQDVVMYDERQKSWRFLEDRNVRPLRKKGRDEMPEAFQATDADTIPATAAGIQFKTPSGHALFLKRGPDSDYPGTWCWPGGGIEGDETPEQAARRETEEEIGYKAKEELTRLSHEANDQGAFTTFGQGVPEPFVPRLNEEHVAHAWAPLNDPPMPLHPGVEAMLKSVSARNAKLAGDEAIGLIAFDRSTARRMDPDGHLHVAVTNISKANVCPYLGKEIPDYEELGLAPEKVYMLYRHPEELAKAAPTFNNKPLLDRHVENNAEDYKQERVIGSTGTDAVFEHPYLKNSLVVWSAPHIEGIEDESQKELSSAYRYRADMTPGEIDGVKFDGVMRDIIGNHVALVKEGRAGSDVVVGDSTEELNMKHALSLKAVMARGALAAFLAPKLAQDAKIPLTSILNGVTAKNFAAKKPLILKSLNDAIKGKLAKDESGEGLKKLLDALEGEPVVDDADPMEDATFDKDDLDAGVNPELEHQDDPAKGEDGPMEAIMEFLKGKLSPEDMAQIEAMCQDDDDAGAMDDPIPFKGMPEKGGGMAGGEKKPEPAKDKDMVSKEDAEKMVKGASDAVRTEVLKTQREVRDAERLVKPYVGELDKAYDSASEVLKAALTALEVEGIDKINDVNALTVILKQQPVPGAKPRLVQSIGMDAKAASSFAERHPGAARIKTL